MIDNDDIWGNTDDWERENVWENPDFSYGDGTADVTGASSSDDYASGTEPDAHDDAGGDVPWYAMYSPTYDAASGRYIAVENGAGDEDAPWPYDEDEDSHDEDDEDSYGSDDDDDSYGDDDEEDIDADEDEDADDDPYGASDDADDPYGVNDDEDDDEDAGETPVPGIIPGMLTGGDAYDSAYGDGTYGDSYGDSYGGAYDANAYDGSAADAGAAGESADEEPAEPISDEEIRRIAMEALAEDDDQASPVPTDGQEPAEADDLVPEAPAGPSSLTPPAGGPQPHDHSTSRAVTAALIASSISGAYGARLGAAAAAAPQRPAPAPAPAPQAPTPVPQTPEQPAPQKSKARKSKASKQPEPREPEFAGAAAEGQTAQPAPDATQPQSPSDTLPFAPVKPTSRTSPSASGRISGAAQATGALAWGSRTDVGRVRGHNEDSYLVNFPLFAVADGMGGHAAGEVASTIAVSTLASCGLVHADAAALGAAVEQANLAVLDGVAQGMGRQGMGTTCTAVVIDGDKMAVGHVGDSRAYMLHDGKLLRVTHDHSFVEELVDAGEITPEEARVHPSRSIITRALGSDPHMRADAFTVDVSRGDRILLCSDGLSSMVTDDVIEEAMVTSPAPQACADRLVDLALEAGGLDNVTAIVIDVKDDGIERHALRTRVRNVGLWVLAVLLVLAAICGGVVAFAQHTWYLSDSDGYVALNKGIPGSIGALTLHETVEQTNIEVSKLSEAVEERLKRGISFGSEDDARLVLEQYRHQISANGATAPQASGEGEGAASAVSESSSSAGEGA